MWNLTQRHEGTKKRARTPRTAPPVAATVPLRRWCDNTRRLTKTSFAGTRRDGGFQVSRTTKLYDRRGQKVLLEDMERIRY
jgi:hypothetical protein